MAPQLTESLTVLSAMITPAVLLSACASLIIATTSRLTRAVDRTRELSQRFKKLQESEWPNEELQAEARMLFVQLDYSTSRSRLLQRGLAGLYYSVCAFVATSVAIATTALTDWGFAIPITLGIGGSAFLLNASLILVRESRIALTALQTEMDYVWTSSKAIAAEEMLELSRRKSVFRRKGR